jgi:hypothetical protein
MVQGIEQKGKRSYQARIEVTYLGGSLPNDAAEALAGAVSEAAAGVASGLSFSISTRHHDTIVVSATVRGGSSLEAITYLNSAVDDAMFQTGLVEKFDVSGKVFQIAPLEQSSLTKALQ